MVSKEPETLVVLSSYWPTTENPVSGVFVTQQVRAMVECGFRVILLLQKPLHKRGSDFLDCARLDLPEEAIQLHEILYPLIPDAIAKYARELIRFNGPLLGARVRKVMLKSVVRQRPLGYIVHGLRYGGMSISSWKSLATGPVQLVIHGMDPMVVAGSRSTRSMLAETVKSADQVVVVGRPLINHIASMGFATNEISVIANGTQLVPHGPAVDKSANRIVSVSNLTHLKGIDLNLRALAAIRAGDPSLDWSYRIVGDGAERSALEALSEELGLTGRVHFCGRLSYEDSMAEIATASIFSLPSWGEAFGITYLEAMARRTAVIGCRGWGAEESVVHDNNGLLVEPQSVESLRGALERLLRDQRLRARLSGAAVETVKHFSWERNVSETVALLRSASADGHTALLDRGHVMALIS